MFPKDSPAATAWQTYDSYRDSFGAAVPDLLTDALDGVFRIKDNQLSLAEEQLNKLSKNTERGYTSNIPLPFKEILFSNVGLFLNTVSDSNHTMNFLQSLAVDGIIDPLQIAPAIAEVISYRSQPPRIAPLAVDSKCIEQHSVFLTAGSEGKAVRLDWHSTSYPISSVAMVPYCGVSVTILSMIVSSVNYEYLNGQGILSNIINDLYPDNIVPAQMQADVTTFLNTILDPVPSPPTPAPVPGPTPTIKKKVWSLSNEDRSLSKRPFNFHHAASRGACAVPQNTNYIVNLPMGTATSARQPIEAWLQSSIRSQQKIKMHALGASGLPEEFDVVCTVNGELESQLLVSVTGPGVSGLEDDGMFGGFWDFVGNAAKSLVSDGIDWAVNAVGEI